MANSQEGGPPSNSEAAEALQQLLDRQLSTTGRLEIVDFNQATESMRCIGHASGGVASLAEFQEHAEKQRLVDEKAWTLRDLLQSKGLSDSEIKDHIQKIGEEASSPLGTADKGVPKRKRYGPHPRFVEGEEVEHQQRVDLSQVSDIGMVKAQQNREQHATGLRSSGRNDSVSSELVIMGGRKALLNLDRGELFKGTTPQERARSTEESGPRSVTEVFASPAPPVLDMSMYLEQRRQEALTASLGRSHADRIAWDDLAPENLAQGSGEGEPAAVTEPEVPQEVIEANRLSEEEIRELPGGKFMSYTPGVPSCTLYIKNLAADVAEPDLVGLFGRFETSRESKLLYRLMQRGRMKGQAFITLNDADTARNALKLVNGYMLKGKPLVIEFARGVKPSAAVPVEGRDAVSAKFRRRRAVKDKRSSSADAPPAA